jgi:hypothetical protein
MFYSCEEEWKVKSDMEEKLSLFLDETLATPTVNQVTNLIRPFYYMQNIQILGPN